MPTALHSVRERLRSLDLDRSLRLFFYFRPALWEATEHSDVLLSMLSLLVPRMNEEPEVLDDLILPVARDAGRLVPLLYNLSVVDWSGGPAFGNTAATLEEMLSPFTPQESRFIRLATPALLRWVEVAPLDTALRAALGIRPADGFRRILSKLVEQQTVFSAEDVPARDAQSEAWAHFYRARGFTGKPYAPQRGGDDDDLPF